MFDRLGIFSIAVALVALVLNVCLLPVIAFRSGANIGSYKILLFINTFIAAVYSAGHAILVPAFFVNDGAWVFYSTNSYVPVMFSTTVVFSFSLGYVLIVEALCVSFLYRLFAMKSRGENQGWFATKQRVACIVGVCGIIALYQIGIQIYCFRPTQEFSDSIAVAFCEQSLNDIHDVGYFGGHVYNKDESINLGVLNVVVSYSIFIAAGCVLMVYCSVRIMREFRSSVQMSTKVTSYDMMQKRLFWLLLLQAAFPFIFTLTGPLILFMLALPRISPGTYPSDMAVGMVFASVVEPILVVYFVSDYRKFINKLIHRKIWPTTVTGTITA